MDSPNTAAQPTVRGLRYPSDLSDAEWALIEPMIPPARRGGRRRSVNVREVAQRDLLRAFDRLPVEGACPRTCRRRARRITTSCCGTGTARWSASITRSMSRCASRQDAKRARRRRSSTARAPRRSKRGLHARPAGLRCGQEGHGPQAAYPRRHARPPAERRRSCPPTFRIATAPAICCGARGGCSPSSNASSPMAATRDRKMAKPIARDRQLEDGDRQAHRSASLRSSCPNAGSSNAPSPGSAAIVVSRATSSAMPQPSPPSSASQ